MILGWVRGCNHMSCLPRRRGARFRCSGSPGSISRSSAVCPDAIDAGLRCARWDASASRATASVPEPRARGRGSVTANFAFSSLSTSNSMACWCSSPSERPGGMRASSALARSTSRTCSSVVLNCIRYCWGAVMGGSSRRRSAVESSSSGSVAPGPAGPGAPSSPNALAYPSEQPGTVSFAH